MIRRNVLVDLGKVDNMLGADLIETPDIYKRIPCEGTVISVGSKCRIVTREFLGKTVVIGLQRHEDNRLTPEASKRLGLKEHWHFIMFEEKIQMKISDA